MDNERKQSGIVVSWRPRVVRNLICVVLCGVLSSAAFAEPRVIDLTNLEDHEVKVLKGYSGSPQKGDFIEDFPIKVPEFTRGICHDAHARYWRNGSNKIRSRTFSTKFPGNEKVGTRFFLLHLKDGRYLAFLPIGGDQAQSYLGRKDSAIYLRLFTYGELPLKGDIPLYSTAVASTPYEAGYKAWKHAIECENVKGDVRLREQKKFYTISKYLGWISWGAFKKNINEANISRVIQDIKESQVPIRAVMLDDGHQKAGGNSSLVHLKKKFDGKKLKWMGLWYPFHMGADDKMIAALKPHLHSDGAFPKSDQESVNKWFDYLLGAMKRNGADYLKIDFHGGERSWARGMHPYKFSRLMNKGIEEASHKHNLPLIQCNWNYNAGHFASKYSAIARCTGDYFSPGSYRVYKAKSMPYDGYMSTVYLGHLVWGDHDHIAPVGNKAGRMDCVRRAMSGGGMFLYQVPGKFEQPVSGVCYQDGLILRPLAPAAATIDSMFRRLTAPKLFVAMAPLPNKTAVFHVMNIDGLELKDGPEHEATISVSDYQNASGMIQPYPGLWPVPPDGLYVFEQFTGRGQVMGKEYKTRFAGFTDRLIQVSPIRNGWSVIGRTDKYLSAAAVEILSRDNRTLKIKLHEAGPLGVYSSKGKPKAKGLQFKDAGNGLYKADIPIGELNKTIVIER
ncbi:MAG: hypothetical protein ISS69_08390 [Phycisphaerae bacterium]|nr:hypothetical protein [Phycisphaerae bacterium]